MSAQAAVIIGASGGIGRALVDAVQDGCVHAVSRSAAPDALASHVQWHVCADDAVQRAETVSRIGRMLKESDAELRRVIVCSGTLHGEHYRPERALRELDAGTMQTVFHVNAMVPMLWLAALEPLMRRSPGCVAAFLSARVGSIADNRLGGWYSYRGSKSALNMMLKSAAIELARRAPAIKLVAFHPGTTDTPLSEPFQARVPEEKLFTPAYVADRLLTIMESVNADGTLSYLDWAGERIDW
ncbi:SDR family NAD(P)-dependent oxidoreductase [Chromatocurvus halotolerans]|uniref:Short-subunit dehydrogenase n=1 Tax=Chromatocurvus halotolerans TaxID=1132028 RepID=A0A4R2LE21_9GAMM|nr:SDR family NAD(P)-dependent oxidoreductase [Chromatocurvus halotolerans]TCO77585.1 short-subunit dehydrogenase [Chromatocurvus halotolerans]